MLGQGNLLPQPAAESLVSWIACAALLAFLLRNAKEMFWPKDRAELAEKVALASRAVDELAQKQKELRDWAHESIHKLAETLQGNTVRLALVDARQEQTSKMVEKVGTSCEEQDRKLTRLLALCENWMVIKTPDKHSNKTT